MQYLIILIESDSDVVDIEVMEDNTTIITTIVIGA